MLEAFLSDIGILRHGQAIADKAQLATFYETSPNRRFCSGDDLLNQAEQQARIHLYLNNCDPACKRRNIQKGARLF